VLARPRRLAYDGRMRCRSAKAGLIVVALAAGVAVTGSRAAASQTYIDRIADLPLMDGLSEVDDAGVSFDKPSGRIVEAFAHGSVAAGDVRRFYRDTLPQLGWTRVRRDTFAREEEKLTLDYLGERGDLTVRFTLQPR
jgi:hypothetical protein